MHCRPEEALNRHDAPRIFNTDQGSEFAAFAFTGTLRDVGIEISMDGGSLWIEYHDCKRPHSALDDATPGEIYTRLSIRKKMTVYGQARSTWARSPNCLENGLHLKKRCHSGIGVDRI